MAYGTAMRTGLLAVAFWASLAVASSAQTKPRPEPERAVVGSDLLDWIANGLDDASAASQTGTPPTPALGEGPIGQALDWLLGSGEPQPAALPKAKAAHPTTAMQAVPASTPVAIAAETMDPPEDEPFSLTSQPRPVATARSQGLLLPVTSP